MTCKYCIFCEYSFDLLLSLKFAEFLSCTPIYTQVWKFITPCKLWSSEILSILKTWQNAMYLHHAAILWIVYSFNLVYKTSSNMVYYTSVRPTTLQFFLLLEIEQSLGGFTTCAVSDKYCSCFNMNMLNIFFKLKSSFPKHFPRVSSLRHHRFDARLAQSSQCLT